MQAVETMIFGAYHCAELAETGGSTVMGFLLLCVLFAGPVNSITKESKLKQTLIHQSHQSLNPDFVICPSSTSNRYDICYIKNMSAPRRKNNSPRNIEKEVRSSLNERKKEEMI